MKRGILILFWLLCISHQAPLCQALDAGERMKRSVADANASLFNKTWPGIDAENQTAPVGLIDRLPPDGTWARFRQDDNYVTIASVGKMVVAGQPNRWIEVILEVGGQDLIWKLLVSEKLPKRGRNILEQALSVWHCGLRAEQRNITGMIPTDEFGDLTFILTGPDQEIRPLEPQTIETKLGRFECTGWTGRQFTRFGQIEFDATFRQWVHEKAPFGVLRSEIEYSSKYDGNIRQAKDSITLVEVGTGAHSRISTDDLSIEELMAQPFSPAAGWQWAVLPGGTGWASMGTRGLAMAMNKNDRELRFTLAHPSTSGGPGGVQYQPIAFDAHQRRYELSGRGGAGSGTVGLAIFALDRDVLPADQVKYIGVEKLDQQARKEPASLIGTPLPDFLNVGFNFVPKRPVDKAFLICFFDMNQRPSRNCIMRLSKKAHELKGKDIVVVAIQASKIDEDKLNTWAKENNIPFCVGMIEGDEEKNRFTWGVQSLPWLILTDAEHIVHAVGFGIDQLDTELAKTDQPITKEEIEKHQREVAEVEIRRLGGEIIVKTSENGGEFTEVKFLGSRYQNEWKGGNLGTKYLSGLCNLKNLRIQDVETFTDEGMVYLEELNNLESLMLVRTQVTDNGLAHIKELTNLEFLGLWSNKFTDTGLKHIIGMTNLKSLRLDDTEVTNDGLKRLKENGLFGALEFLSLNRTKISNEGLAHLTGMQNLKRLYLSDTQITSVGLDYIGGLTKLEVLILTNTDISDEGLLHLKTLTNLNMLYLRNTKITNTGLAHLEKMTNLVQLWIGGTKITDTGLVYLKALNKLESLDLSQTQVTNSGLSHLEGLTSLNELFLGNSGVTIEGYLELNEALPDCQIYWEQKKDGEVGAAKEKTRFNWGVKSLPWLILTGSKNLIRAEGFSLTELDDKIEAAN